MPVLAVPGDADVPRDVPLLTQPGVKPPAIPPVPGHSVAPGGPTAPASPHHHGDVGRAAQVSHRAGSAGAVWLSSGEVVRSLLRPFFQKGVLLPLSIPKLVSVSSIKQTHRVSECNLAEIYYDIYYTSNLSGLYYITYYT